MGRGGRVVVVAVRQGSGDQALEKISLLAALQPADIQEASRLFRVPRLHVPNQG